MIDSILQRAHQLIQLSRFEEATRELKTLLASEPENTEAIALLSICYAEQNKLDEAMSLIQQAVGKSPDNDYYLYLQSLIFFKKGNLKDAEKFIRNAIAFHPRSADYYGVLATVKLNQKEWQQALDAANEGLAIDPDNLACLNARSTALFKLDLKDEAYSTIQRALQKDPENEFTHTNIGWGLLEKGDHVKALEHFREALKINPNHDAAKAGLVEALKGRYWFYRIFLRYAFWLSNFRAKGQWALIIGVYVGIKLLQKVADTNENLAVFIKPIVYLYMAFAISTWLITPLSNLFLRLNVYGRYALTREEIDASTFVGISLLVGLFGGGFFIFQGDLFYLIILLYGISMMIPLGSMFNPTKDSSKKTLIAATIALGVVGFIVILQAAFTNEIGVLWPVYIFGLVAYQWLTNAMIIK